MDAIPCEQSKWKGEYSSGALSNFSSLSLNADGTYEASHRSCSYTAVDRGVWTDFVGGVQLTSSESKGSVPYFQGRYRAEEVDGDLFLISSRFSKEAYPHCELVHFAFVKGGLNHLSQVQNDAWVELKPRINRLRLMQRSNQPLQTDASRR